MDNRTFQINVNGYKSIVDRVNKTTARKAYNDNQTVFVLPVNLCPGMAFQPCPIAPPQDNADREHKVMFANDWDFDRRIRNHDWYNCNDTETGYYSAYYLLRQ